MGAFFINCQQSCCRVVSLLYKRLLRVCLRVPHLNKVWGLMKLWYT